MDKLFINQLKLLAKIGILPRERQAQQMIYVDIELSVDARPAAATDEIHDAADYAAIRERVIAVVQQRHYNLVETLAERLAECLIEDFPIAGCRLSITKPGAFDDAEGAGIVIERSKAA